MELSTYIDLPKLTSIITFHLFCFFKTTTALSVQDLYFLVILLYPSFSKDTDIDGQIGNPTVFDRNLNLPKVSV